MLILSNQGIVGQTLSYIKDKKRDKNEFAMRDRNFLDGNRIKGEKQFPIKSLVINHSRQLFIVLHRSHANPMSHIFYRNRTAILYNLAEKND